MRPNHCPLPARTAVAATAQHRQQHTVFFVRFFLLFFFFFFFAFTRCGASSSSLDDVSSPSTRWSAFAAVLPGATKRTSFKAELHSWGIASCTAL